MVKINQSQLDLFIASASDVSPKNHRDLMSRCWFSLSKKKRTEDINHKFDNVWVRVKGSPEHGLATIFDNDVLIFTIAQLMSAINDKRKVGRRFQFTGYEYFKFIGRKSLGGKSYNDIWNSLQRLHNTFIETNIRQEENKRHHSFNWLSEIKQVVENGKHRGYEIILAEWLYDSVVNQKMVLTLDRDYFNIKGGLERWLYLFARKSSGWKGKTWRESLRSIYEKSGSLGSFKEFSRTVRNISKKGLLCGYELNAIEFSKRKSKKCTFKYEVLIINTY